MAYRTVGKVPLTLKYVKLYLTFFEAPRLSRQAPEIPPRLPGNYKARPHVLRRGASLVLRYRNSIRPDMAPGCHERFSPEFARWVWNYLSRSRPKVLEMLKSHSQTKTIVWLRSRSDVERFLEGASKTK